MQWSPYGSYLATLHRQGVAVWGGIAFKQLQKYAHPDVRRIDISPNERYLVTSSTVKDKEGMLEILVFIFDVRSGQKLRVFKGYPEDFMRFEDTASGKAMAAFIRNNKSQFACKQKSVLMPPSVWLVVVPCLI